VDGVLDSRPVPFIKVLTEEEARGAVHQVKQYGGDFVKVYSTLSAANYKAIADECNKLNMPFAGHAPHAVSIQEIISSRQRSIEHLNALHHHVSSNDSAIVRRLSDAIDGHVSVREFNKLYLQIRKEAFDSYNQEKAHQVAKELKAGNVWFCPTVSVLQSIRGHLKTPEGRKDYENVPDNVYESFVQTMFNESKTDSLFLLELFERELQLLKVMISEKVNIISGSDASPSAGTMPGYSLHNELIYLVRCGMTPHEALKTATLNPASYFGKTNDFGTIDKGKYADLVLLDANPLSNIGNVRKINTLFLKGMVFDRHALDEMEKEMEQTLGK
jgi:hypothetical protein